jgi:hypothetical protein
VRDEEKKERKRRERTEESTEGKESRKKLAGSTVKQGRKRENGRKNVNSV